MGVRAVDSLQPPCESEARSGWEHPSGCVAGTLQSGHAWLMLIASGDGPKKTAMTSLLSNTLKGRSMGLSAYLRPAGLIGVMLAGLSSRSPVGRLSGHT